MRHQSLAKAYLAHMKARGARPCTLKNNAAGLRCFFAHLKRAGVQDCRAVRESDIVSFRKRLGTLRSSRTRRPLAASTQAVYMVAVHGLFRYLASQRRILLDPARGVPLPKRPRLPRALSEAEARGLVDGTSPEGTNGLRNRALLELLYGTGLRISECVRLDLVDVDLASGTILVRGGKGSKDRYVPLSGQAAKALGLYLTESRPRLEKAGAQHQGAVFLSRYGKRLGCVSVSSIVRDAGRSVGIKASTHVLRHSYATHLLRGGANVREVQELLGHKEVTTTALYTKVDVRDLKAMVERCHPRERRRKSS